MATDRMAKSVVMMRLGDIQERLDLSPRDHLSHEVVQEYVRRLRNGEVPPPMVVTPGSVLFAGHHRYQAWQEFVGEGWGDHQVEVVVRDDLPDPDRQPELFRLEAAVENRNHGLRVDRVERRKLATAAALKVGVEAVRQYAAQLNETEESMDELLGILAARWASAGDGQAGDGGTAVGQGSSGGKYRAEAFPTSHIESFTPAIWRLCRKLRAVLDGRTAPLTSKDAAELEATAAAIASALERLAPAGEAA
jgi:hypothetical protein